jgi:DedD protein
MSREPELYKDKIEVSLDGRQIFYLFFGGSVIVGLVFVLGVMVGRRVEARGHVERAHVETAVDPLAALDRLEAGSGLSFQASLRGAEPAVTPVEKKIADVVAEKKAEAKPEARAEAKAEAKAEARAEKKINRQDAEVAKPEAKAEKKLNHRDTEATEKTAEKTDDKKPEEKKSKFTLQLSSFQDKAEADAYVQSVKSAGFQAYVTQGEVDGKQFFRVRLGSYRTLEAANDAKADFEKSAKKSALVTRL